MVDSVSGMAYEKSGSSEDEEWDIDLTEGCSDPSLVPNTHVACNSSSKGPRTCSGLCEYCRHICGQNTHKNIFPRCSGSCL